MTGWSGKERPCRWDCTEQKKGEASDLQQGEKVEGDGRCVGKNEGAATKAMLSIMLDSSVCAE